MELTTDAVTRNVFMYGDITSELIHELMQQITQIHDYDNALDEQIKDYEREPINLFINSCGGSLLPTIGFCEFIKHVMKTPVIGICMGEACSAAFIVLISCHYRVSVNGASLMAHPMSGGSIGSTRDCENVLNHMKHIEHYIIDAMRNLTKMPKEIVDEMYNKQIDKYFTPDEAKQYQIIDSILGEEVESDEEEPCNIDDEEEPCNIDDDEVS